MDCNLTAKVINQPVQNVYFNKWTEGVRRTPIAKKTHTNKLSEFFCVPLKLQGHDPCYKQNNMVQMRTVYVLQQAVS